MKATKMMIKDVMTPHVISIQSDKTVADAAKAMKDNDIGDVVVMNGDGVYGILTDRDIVVRALANGSDPRKAKVGEIASHSLACISPDDTTDRAVELMREKAIRRLPVLKDGKLVGMVSLGDLAVEKDPNSALGKISAAKPNK